MPQPSQRVIAQRLRVRQPYVAKLFRKIKREGPEKAIGPEAYEIYKALRNAELTKRYEALVAESQRSRCEMTPPRESHPADQAEMARQEGPTEYVELVRTTTDELIELHGSRPYQPQPPTPQPPQQEPHCRAGGLSRWGEPPGIKQLADTHDAGLLAFSGYNPNRSKSWF